MPAIKITLPQRLKGFVQPDTTSESKGFISEGTYPLISFKRDFPNQDTDYAEIDTPQEGKVWICARWKDTKYAEAKSVAEGAGASGEGSVISFADLASVLDLASGQQSASAPADSSQNGVDESAITNLLPLFDSYGYDLKEPAYPYQLEGISVPQSPPNPSQNNCCTFVEAILVKAWQDTIGSFEWNNQRHAQMMIYSADDFFSPITAAVESGMAVREQDVDSAPTPWTIIQGWKTQWTGGHTFLIIDHNKETDAVLTLESNKGWGLDGVGFRKLGMARDFDNQPPANWWQTPGLQTWEQMKALYKFREMATLQVKNQTWVQQP